MSIESMASISEIAREDQLSRVKFWDSRFQFLKITNGLRPKKVSYILGTTGTGKSTLTAGIIADCAGDSPVLIILSEGTNVEYSAAILKAKQMVNQSHIKFIFESEIPESIKRDQGKTWAWIESKIIESGVKIVFWDNLTSSPLFEKFGLNGQVWAVMQIRDLAKKMELAFFVVMHTAKNITDNMGRYIEGEDVRGTQQSFIGADFFYIFQRFSVGAEYFPFIRIVKHRGHNPSCKVFMLRFSNGAYMADAESSFEEMNGVFMKRNVLGKFPSKPKGQQ